jgi:hypothetical protein
MAAGTNSSSVQQLYADILADLVPYYEDAVLLPNQQIIRNSLLVSGSSGDQVRFPLTNAYSDGVTVNEGTSIVGTASSQSNFSPTAANITFAKRGIATDVSEESLEDGGLDLVRSAVLTRLSSGLATATDKAGLLEANSSFTLADTGAGSANASTHKVSFVMSPEAMAYAAKREPVVKMWYNPDTDVHEMRGTVRNGFAVLRAGFGQKISTNKTIGSAAANVVAIAKGVANLRSSNAPTGVDGTYVGIITPAFEFAINDQIALAGGTTIGSLSDLGNNALRDASLALVAGTRLFRSNNLPSAS